MSVKSKATGRTGIVISGIPYIVANRRYVTVRWDDNNETSDVGVWTLARI